MNHQAYAKISQKLFSQFSRAGYEERGSICVDQLKVFHKQHARSDKLITFSFCDSTTKIDSLRI